jgi:hypothetical protein
VGVALLAVTAPPLALAAGSTTAVPLSRHVALGAFAPGAPGDLTTFHALEATLGRKLRIASRTRDGACR